MLNPTQTVGLVAFGGAALASMTRPGRAWRSIGLLHALFVVEVVFGFRHHVHDAIVRILIADHAYAGRHDWQVAMLALLVLAVLIGAMRVALGTHDPAARIAVYASLAVLGLFLAEAVSLHNVDAYFYMPYGPVLRIALFWAAGGSAVILAALVRPSVRRRSGSRRAA